MKKALKPISIILCLAFVFALFAAVPASAAETENLLSNPQFAYTTAEDGTVSVDGWLKSTSSSVEDGEDGYNIVKLIATSNDNTYTLRPDVSFVLDTDKYYKFSVQVKAEKYNDKIENVWGGIYATFQYNSAEVYKSEVLKVSAETDWTELSFIVYGGEIPDGAWDRYFFVKVSGTTATVSVRYPSMTVCDPDEIEIIERTENANLLTNGDFSKYDASIAHTDGNRFTGFSVAGRANNCVNHEQVTVELNGKTTTAAKLTYSGTSYDTKDALFNCYNVISSSKYYRISVWIKLDDADKYDETAGAWVADEGSFEAGYSGGVSFGYQKGNNTAVKSTAISTKGDWQNISMIVNGSDWATTWQSRMGIWVYRMNCNVYLADMRVEELVGEITCETPENTVTNGDFETYDAEASTFDNWSFYNGNNSANTISSAEGVNGNALLITTTTQDYLPTIGQTVSGIDASKNYKASVKVKVENSSYDDKFGHVSWGGGVRMQIANSDKSMVVTTEEIGAVTDGWVTLSAVVDSIPSDTTSLTIILAIGSTKANVYFDDVTLTPYYGGSVVANRTNAPAGEMVYLTLLPDFGKKLAENGLNYTYTAADGTVTTVAVTEHKSAIYTENTAKGYADVEYTGKIYSAIPSDNQNIYQFAMPENVDVTVSALFDNIELITGDANWDGMVDVRDLIRLKKYTAGIELDINLDNCNLDDDATVANGSDLTVLRQMLLGK